MIYENDPSRLFLITKTTKFKKQPVTEQFFLEHSETSINAFSEDFFVHTDIYTALEEKLSQNGNKEGSEKSMEYQTWRVQGFYPRNKIEELKKFALSPKLNHTQYTLQEINFKHGKRNKDFHSRFRQYLRT